MKNSLIAAIFTADYLFSSALSYAFNDSPDTQYGGPCPHWLKPVIPPLICWSIFWVLVVNGMEKGKSKDCLSFVSIILAIAGIFWLDISGLAYR